MVRQFFLLYYYVIICKKNGSDLNEYNIITIICRSSSILLSLIIIIIIINIIAICLFDTCTIAIIIIFAANTCIGVIIVFPIFIIANVTIVEMFGNFIATTDMVDIG